MGLFSSIGGILGGNDAGDKFADMMAALGERSPFELFNVNTPTSSTSFDPTSRTAQTSLSPELLESFNRFGDLSRMIGDRASAFDPTSFQNEFFDARDRLESRRESEAFNSLESKLFNRQGIHTGTGNQVRNFQADLEQRRSDRTTKSIMDSQQFFTNMLNQLLGLESGRAGVAAQGQNAIADSANLAKAVQEGTIRQGKLAIDGASVENGLKSTTASSVGWGS
jgi:hypothetical protein